MTINLKTDPVSKSFYQYLWPALTGMVIKSLFIMGDAWFIGQGVGADGLGAISLTVPAYSIFTAIAMMIGIGGAAFMSIEVGKGNLKIGQTLLTQSLLITAVITSIGVALAMYNLDAMFAMMGATGNIAALATEYLSVMLQFFVLYALAWVLSCFVRNDGNPKLATYAMSIGAILNLALDYLFVLKFEWGMAGAAYATGISQLAIAGILLSHFVRKQGRLTLALEGVGFSQTLNILKIGLPIFFIEVTSAMTIVLFNYVLLHYFSEGHVIAYGMMLNVGVLALFVMVGISQACQPIISFNHGANRPHLVDEILRLGLKAAIGSGVVFLVVVWLFSSKIAAFYLGEQPDLIALSATSLSFYFFGVPLMGFNMVVANLFQATAKPMQATVISLARGFICVAIGIFVLPMFFPENGVWASVLFAEAVTALMSFTMLRAYQRQNSYQPAAA